MDSHPVTSSSQKELAKSETNINPNRRLNPSLPLSKSSPPLISEQSKHGLHKKFRSRQQVGQRRSEPHSTMDSTSGVSPTPQKHARLDQSGDSSDAHFIAMDTDDVTVKLPDSNSGANSFQLSGEDDGSLHIKKEPQDELQSTPLNIPQYEEIHERSHSFPSLSTPAVRESDSSTMSLQWAELNAKEEPLPDSSTGKYESPKQRQQSVTVCQVCDDLAAGFYCGAYICEACKVSDSSYICEVVIVFTSVR